MGKELSRPVGLYILFLLLVLITLTFMSFFLVFSTIFQIRSISASVSNIADRDVTSTKIAKLTDLFVKIRNDVEVAVATNTTEFRYRNRNLFMTVRSVDQKFFFLNGWLEREKGLFEDQSKILFAGAGQTSDLCKIIYRTNLEAESQLNIVLNQRIDEANLEGINKKLQEDILPSKMTFLTGPNFQLNSFLKYRNAKQIHGGDYLAISSNLATDYFPETDLTKIKLSSYATVNGSFLVDTPGTQNSTNIAIYSNVTLTSSATDNPQFTHNLSAFTVYAQEIIPLN